MAPPDPAGVASVHGVIRPAAPATGGRPRGLTRRAVALVAVPLVVVTGLGVHVLGGRLDGAAAGAADLLGDALYAALVVVVLTCAAPRARSWLVAVLGALLCAGLELAQFTGVPADLSARWPVLRLVLGTTFSAPDLPAYAVGAAAAAALLARVRPPLPPSAPRDTRATPGRPGA